MTAALIIIDVQNDFCEGGSLTVGGGADVATAISDYVAKHRGEYADIVATRDYHLDPGGHFSDDPDYVETWPPHCVVGTPGVDFHDNLALAPIEAVFSKGHHTAAYSGFEGSTDDDVPLGEWLRQREITDVDLVGIATDHCVRATALDAARAGFATRILLDMTAGVAKGTTDRALAELRASDVTLVGEPVVRS
ncbi:MAG: isochorismatase hydrolase [Streptosporangiaceae bacterium]|nr:isochorismatase hydrolase [Streptosporangiaceae bacterium]